MSVALVSYVYAVVVIARIPKRDPAIDVDRRGVGAKEVSAVSMKGTGAGLGAVQQSS